MYFLKALQDAQSGPALENVEYRLVCSGELYRSNVITADRTKSDLTRILLLKPFSIFVVSRPSDEFPQELCVRLSVARETERDGNFTRSFVPDVEVVEDLCGILTLLARRLVTRLVKTRERYTDDFVKEVYESELPMPIIGHPPMVAWSRNPKRAVSVDAEALQHFLLNLPKMPNAQEILRAARDDQPSRFSSASCEFLRSAKNPLCPLVRARARQTSTSGRSTVSGVHL